jgi:MFS family permease
MSKPMLWTRNFINTSVSSFFLFTTFYLLLVTLPIHAIQTLHSKEYQAGLVVTVFILAAVIIRPLAGKWIQRFGKKLVLMSSLIIFTGATFLYFIPDSLTGLLLLRFLHGLGFGMATTVCGTIIADIVPDSRRGEGMGYYTMSMNLAMVIGPFVGLTILGIWGITVTFFISICCALISLIFGLFITIPDIQMNTQPIVVQGTNRFSSFYESSALRISLVGAFFALIYSAILSFVSVYAKEIGLQDVSSYFFVVYAVVLLLSRPFTGKWFDSYGANVIVYPAITSFAAGMFLLGIANSPILFLLSAALIGLGWGTLFPIFQTIAIQKALPSNRGLATATFLSVFDLGIGVGSVVVGIIGTKLGFGSFYLFSSLFVLMGCGLYYLMHDKGSRTRIKTSEHHLEM